jgi:small subunit ribosomal protein S20
VANSKSAKKRIRTTQRKHTRNVMYRSRAKTMINKAEAAIFSGELNEEALREAIRTLDKAAGKGILHRNNAARRKSRLVKKYNTLRRELQEAAPAS